MSAGCELWDGNSHADDKLTGCFVIAVGRAQLCSHFLRHARGDTNPNAIRYYGRSGQYGAHARLHHRRLQKEQSHLVYPFLS